MVAVTVVAARRQKVVTRRRVVVVASWSEGRARRVKEAQKAAGPRRILRMRIVWSSSGSSVTATRKSASKQDRVSWMGDAAHGAAMANGPDLTRYAYVQVV